MRLHFEGVFMEKIKFHTTTEILPNTHSIIYQISFHATHQLFTGDLVSFYIRSFQDEKFIRHLQF